MLELDKLLDIAEDQRGGGDVSDFVQQVRPVAERVGQRLGVDPDVLVGQWGLETGWGRSVIPGTNNLGNIKDFSGRGVSATDNATGTSDRYRKYDSTDAFGDDYAGLIERRYRDAIGSGADAERFAGALKAGGYAQDPEYVRKLVGATTRARSGTAPRQENSQVPSAGGSIGALLADYSPESDRRLVEESAAQAPTARAQAQARERDANAGFGEAFVHGFGTATEQVPQLLAGAAAAIGDAAGINALRDSGLAYYDHKSQELSSDARTYDSFSDAIENGEMKQWLGYALGYGVNQIGQSILTGGVGSLIGKVGLTGLLKGTAERVAADALANHATKEAAAKAGMLAAELAARKYGAALAMTGHTYGQELGDIYTGAVDQQAKSGNPIDLAKVFGAAGVAAALEVAPEIGIAGRLIEGAGRAGKTFRRRAAVEVPKYAGIEGGTEYAQTYVEQVGAGQDPNTPEAQKERVDAAALGAVMGGPVGAVSAIPAPKPPRVEKPTNTPDSPVSNAANAVENAGGLPQPEQEAQASPFDQRLQAVAQTVEDRTFKQAVRSSEGLGGGALSDILSAYAKAKNPTMDPRVREHALSQLEQFIQTFANRPNFTFGSGQEGGPAPGTALAAGVPPGGSPVAAAGQDDGMTLEGEVVQRPRPLPGPNPNQLSGPNPNQLSGPDSAPVRGLPSPEALAAKRDADAEYEQAFQDLVKAEALGQSGDELAQEHRRLIEANQRLDEIHSAIIGNREAEAEARRRSILSEVLANPQVQNPAQAFSAALRRAGIRNTEVTEAERQRIARFSELRDTFNAPAEVEPSAPNEFDPYGQRRGDSRLASQPAAAASAPSQSTVNQAPSAAPAAAPGPVASDQTPVKQPVPVNVASIRDAVASGARLAGNSLTIAGTTHTLRGPLLAAARKAERDFNADQDTTAPAVQDRDVSEEPAGETPNPVQQVPEVPGTAGTQGGGTGSTVGAPANDGRPSGDGRVDGTAASAQAAGQTAPAGPGRADSGPTLADVESIAQRLLDIYRSQGKEAANAAYNGLPESAPDDVIAAIKTRFKALRDAQSQAAPATGKQSLTVAPPAQPTTQEPTRGTETPQAQQGQPAAAQETDAIDEELKDALSHLGDVLGDVFGQQLKVTGKEYGAADLLPALSKVIELLVRKGFKSFKEAIGASAKAMRAHPATAGHVDKLSPRQWRAAYNAVAEFHPGTDDEATVNATTDLQIQKVIALPAKIAEAESTTDHGATDQQKEAENYQTGKFRWNGLQVSVENAKDSTRSKTDKKTGETWSVTMPATYGRILGYVGADKDHVDIFMGEHPHSEKVWVINQNKVDSPDLDEHKVMAGFTSEEEARDTYLASFSNGFGARIFGSITGPFSPDDLRARLDDGEFKRRKPVGLAKGQRSDANVASEAPPAADKPAPAGTGAAGAGLNVQTFKHTKTGKDQFVVQLPQRLDAEPYQAVNRRAIAHKGRYSKFSSGGAIPGFLFRTRVAAEAFASDPVVVQAATKEAPPTQADQLTYDQFKAEMQRLLNESMKYTPTEVGSGVFAEKMADLADRYPEFQRKLDDESEQPEPAGKKSDKAALVSSPSDERSVFEREADKMEILPVGDDASGEFVVGYQTERGRQNFARFRVSEKTGKPVGIQYFYESHTNREPARIAISRWAGTQKAAAEEAAPNYDGIDQGGQGNEPIGDDRADESALAPVSPGELQGAAAGEPAGSGSGSVRRPDAGRDGDAGEVVRDESGGSVAGQPESVLPEGPDVVAIDGASAPLDDVAESVRNDAPASEPKPKSPPRKGDNPGNYSITDAESIGTGTPGERIRANLAAIRLVLDLEREDRYPTRAEQAVLAKYVGWGGLKNVFKGENSDSKQEREAHAELKRLLTDDQLFWMGQSVLDAHYTSPAVVRSMYRVLDHFGVSGGRFLEPTVGVGNFLGMMPAGLASSSKWYASEIDPITSLIAKNLYPEAQILPATGFQDAEFPYGRMDVAIGNPPFGDQRITDNNKKRESINGFKIHNYIIAKSAMHLRPGGVMAFVVTSRFMDTANAEARDFLSKNFRMLAAIRLPNTAFKENAGTEVTTDLVFLQRMRDASREASEDDQSWLDTNGHLLNEDGETVTLNRYFADNPEMMLGKPTMSGTMYGTRTRGEFALLPREGSDIERDVEALLDGRELAPLKGVARPRAVDLDTAAAAVEMNREDVPIGGFLLENGRVIQREDDGVDGNVRFRQLTPETPWTEKTALGETRLGRIKGMLELRAAAYALMADERADAPAASLEAQRKALNSLYDTFVDAYGFLNDNANRSLMSYDPRIEFGLETNYRKAITKARAKQTGQEPTPAEAEKSSLLKERVFYPHKEILSAENARDGYAVSLSERGRLDIGYIAELTDKSKLEVIQELSGGDAPLIFEDPETGKWVQEDEYLSGNVKQKLKQARGAKLEANIRALEAVQPADVPAEEIHVEFGATWVPENIYEEFLKLLGYSHAKVAVMPLSGAVDAVMTGGSVPSAFRADLENPDYTIDQVFTAAANRKPLVAYDRVGEERHVNRERTENLARIRGKLIAIWNDWVKADPERATLIAGQYNEKMNTTIDRKYDGVGHLKAVGSNPSVTLRNTQKNGAWRMIQSPSVLLDHVVGAGKTMTYITGMMERRRLGVSKKPLVVVPNSLVGQWARDWMQLYPGANILAATEKDFQKQNRRRLFARIATGNFDAVIVGHSSFGFIPVSRENKMEFIRGEVAHLNAALTEAENADGGKKKGNGDSRRVRAIKNRIAKRMEKIRELQAKPRDNVVTFEDMGIDYLAVDELHEFKNLEYATQLSNVAGMGSPEGSKKAFDLFMKIRLLQANGGAIAGATGTPISNSMVEMYSLLRYMNPEALKTRGLEQFDAWVKAHATIEPRDEYTPAGQVKQKTVMAAFNNLPELLQIYKQFADTVTMTDLKRSYSEQVRDRNARTGEKAREEFPVPKVKGGSRELDMGEPTPEQSEFMDYLIARADVLDKLKGKARQEYAKIDNALWLMNDARKMSLDVRIIDPTVPDSPNSKSSRAARRIKQIYDRWDKDRGAQLVFCDLSTPAKSAGKDAAKFIQAAMKAFGVENDPRVLASMDGRSYEGKWVALMAWADQALGTGALDDVRRERVEDFIEKAGDEEVSALRTADVGFSVYDDLRSKLIESGIPEREIAFIHDANTAEKKRDLFDLVNGGKVRVLIGSSAKMGAGMNAQRRLVALHHMDAPWRPSDIEQREGRIIRQGNMFYQRDPDKFEVELIAYSTERTFDAQMWGVLARKAAFLEQFRHGLRTITEEGSDAASYAEFMAEATGNQVFRDKLRLERELGNLEADDRSARMKLSAAQNLISRAEARRADIEDAITEAQRLSAIEFDSITFEGKTYRNDYAQALQAENERFNAERDAYEDARTKYNLDRKAWEDAAGSDRGRAPEKPKAPQGVDATSERFREISEWARFIDSYTKSLALLGPDDETTFQLQGSSGERFAAYAHGFTSMGGSVAVRVTIGGETFVAGDPRAPSFASGLTPRAFVAHTANLLQDKLRARHNLDRDVRQAELTIENVKPVSPEEMESARARYEAVKNEVDAISAQMAEERAKRRNRFIENDKRRFSGGAEAMGEGAATGDGAITELRREVQETPERSYKFRAIGTGLQREISVAEGAKPVVLDGIDGLEFFALNDKVRNGWFIIEASTGLSIENGETRKAAIDLANQRVASMGAERIKSLVEGSQKITDEEKTDAVGRFLSPAVTRTGPTSGRALDTATAERIAGDFRERFPGSPPIEVARSFADLPGPVKDSLKDQSVSGNVRGAFHRGTVYLVADSHESAPDLQATIFHEILGHFAIRSLFGSEFVQMLNQVFFALGGAPGLQKIMDRRGHGGTFSGYVQRLIKANRDDPEQFTEAKVRAILTEEVYAFVAEEGGKGLRDRLLRILGWVRDFLRRTGLAELADMSESDLLHTLAKARRAMRDGTAVVVESGDAAPAVGGDTINVDGIERPTTNSDGRPRVTDGPEDIPGDADDEDAGGTRNGPVQADRPGLQADQNADRTLGGAPRPGWAEATRIRRTDGRPAAAARGASSRLVAEHFRREALGRSSGNPSAGLGVWFALTQRGDVGRYGPVVEEFNLDIRNPKVFTTDTFPGFDSPGAAFLFRENLRRQGFDGIIVDHRDAGGPVHAVAFDPVQVVRTAEDRDDPPAVARMVAGADATPGRLRVMDRLAGLFDTARTFNWWDRTVGSQYGKAKKSPEFARVFVKAKAFVTDVSRFANRAADLARSILPHLDTLADVGKGLNVPRQWHDAKDYREIAGAIFQGTLEGVSFTRKELADRFGLDDRQAGLYGEFRDAVDFSLETLAASELARSARAAGLKVADPDMTIDEALDYYTGQIDPSIEAAEQVAEGLRLRHQIEREELDSIIPDETYDLAALQAAKDVRDRRQAAERRDAEDAIKSARAFRASFTDKVERIRELQAQGYAPLMRFGQYTVDVVRLDDDGKVVLNTDGEPDRPFFGMFESESEAKEAARIFAEEYPGYTVARGVLSTKGNELFRGLTPETAEIFARLLGTSTDEAFQAYLKQAISNRSAMRRLIHRKGMAGFSNDVPRVLAAFLTSNARMAAGNWHFGEMAEAASEIPQHMGDVKDEAVRLIQYIQNPQEEAAGLRGFMFFSFLGGSVASMAVNMTQTFTTTLPYLSQFGGDTVKELTAAMALAGKLMVKKDAAAVIKDRALLDALHRAIVEGVVDPQEVYLLMAESGAGGSLVGSAVSAVGKLTGKVSPELGEKIKAAVTPAERVGRAAAQGWGSLFSFSEKYNRHVAFLAAYKLAPAGVDPYEFAKTAVEETQFLYGKQNRSNWARGPVGAVIFTFRSFLINYLEFLSRLPRREQALALGVLVLLAGMSGLPGWDDYDDLVDALGQKLGYNWNNKAGRHAWLVSTFGADASNFIEHGVSSLLPLDISGRLSVANLIPGTGALKKSDTDRSRDASEVLGVAGSLASGLFSSWEAAGSGRPAKDVLRPILPKAFNDLFQAVEMLQTGQYRDSRGRRIVDAGWLDSLVKAAGFYPNSAAEPRRVEFMLAQSAAMVRAVRADIHELMARGQVDGNAEQVRLAREMLVNWNRKNPDTPIRLNPASVAQRVRAMRATSAGRLVKATPREMRGMVRAEMDANNAQ